MKRFQLDENFDIQMNAKDPIRCTKLQVKRAHKCSPMIMKFVIQLIVS